MQIFVTNLLMSCKHLFWFSSACPLYFDSIIPNVQLRTSKVFCCDTWRTSFTITLAPCLPALSPLFPCVNIFSKRGHFKIVNERKKNFLYRNHIHMVNEKKRSDMGKPDKQHFGKAKFGKGSFKARKIGSKLDGS